MENPFKKLDDRLNKIETLLNDIKTTSPKEESTDEDIPLNIEEVAKLTGYTTPTLYGYCRRNEIPYHKKGNRNYFFKTEIISWIKTGKQKTLKELEEDAIQYVNKKSNS